MPRLFDLLPENSKKELLAEVRKGKEHQKPLSQPKNQNHLSHNNTKGTTEEKAEPLCIDIPDFVALDVETTGLDFKNDRIIEVGAVKFIAGKAREDFSTFINAGMIIPAHISELTKITNEDLTKAPSFNDIVEKLLSFIGNLPLCGHQVEFDITFINEELKKANRPEQHFQILDTALLSRILLQQPLQRFSLKHVTESLEVKLSNAHRALHDARASGEVAILLIPKLVELPLPIRQTIAACAPGSLFKSIIIKTLGEKRPLMCLNPGKSFATFPKLGTPEDYESIDLEAVQKSFKAEGTIAKGIESYIPRESQIEMAVQVGDALNNKTFLIAEAGTGTGKSLAYLYPAALWAIKNDCRVIISTRTRNLQDQLISRDIPVVSKLTGGTLRYSVLKGRNNYLCRHRFHRLLNGDLGNLSPRERTAILPLIPWSEHTKTGDIEEQNHFNPKWFNKIWNIISSDSQDCSGRRCPYNGACFLQNARNQALSSHIVVINHSLFFSEISSESSFLGKMSAIVFDEAHHLEASGYRHLRVELDTNRITLITETLNDLVQEIADFKEDKEIYDQGKNLRTLLKSFRKRSSEFLDQISHWALLQQPAQARDYQIAYHESPFSSIAEVSAFEAILLEIMEILYHLKQAAAGSIHSSDLEELQAEIQAASDKASQLKADFKYLIAAVTEDHVFWIEGNHEKGWVKLCGVPLNIGEILSTIWDRCDGAAVFTSATLSVSRSVDYFKRGTGLDQHETKTTCSFFKSPFNPGQEIKGAVRNAPDPDSPDYPSYVAGIIAELHVKFSKNILVLFTANLMMNAVNELLKNRNDVEKSSLLAQGISGTRNSMLEQFRQNTKMILLGTDSFWEGIDAPGEACEIVIIPRLPFPVPTQPLTQAIAKKMEDTYGESFFSYSIPEAVIKFRQGAGRLIRTSSDRGALVVLDNRIATKGYGKQFTRSLEGDFICYADKTEMIEKISEFFARDPADLGFSRTYVPLEDV